MIIPTSLIIVCATLFKVVIGRKQVDVVFFDSGLQTC
jgi:hypothetical protein